MTTVTAPVEPSLYQVCALPSFRASPLPVVGQFELSRRAAEVRLVVPGVVAAHLREYSVAGAAVRPSPVFGAPLRRSF